MHTAMLFHPFLLSFCCILYEEWIREKCKLLWIDKQSQSELSFNTGERLACACSLCSRRRASLVEKRIKKEEEEKNRNISYLFSTLHKMQNEKWKGKTLFFVVIFFDSDFLFSNFKFSNETVVVKCVWRNIKISFFNKCWRWNLNLTTFNTFAPRIQIDLTLKWILFCFASLAPCLISILNVDDDDDDGSFSVACDVCS